MPSIFLSPSTQEYNRYYDDSGSEEYYMNLIADAMEPYLEASGIMFRRNNPNATLSQAIRESNEGTYDLHLAIHSNAAPDYLAGELMGTDFYYYARSAAGERAASVLADNFMKIYPVPSKVNTMPTTTLAEVTRTRAPSVLVEVAYHDNEGDAEWIKANIEPIARNLVQGVALYLNVPFADIGDDGPDSGDDGTNGTVITQTTALNLRRYPNTEAAIIGKIPKGARVTVYGRAGEWYIVEYDGVRGFAYSEYIATDSEI